MIALLASLLLGGAPAAHDEAPGPPVAELEPYASLLESVEDVRRRTGQDERRARREQAPVEVPELFEVGLPVDRTLSFLDAEGRRHEFAALQDKVIVLEFWSNRCPWSRRAEKKMIALRHDLDPESVAIFAVASNAADLERGREDGYLEIREYCAKNGTTYPVLLDAGHVLARRFQATTTPHCFVVDTKGILRYAGGIDDDPREKGNSEERTDWLRNAVRAVLVGEDVPEPVTKPFGCALRTEAEPRRR